MHEREIQAQGDQRFFFLAASRLSRVSHAVKNQEKPQEPG